MFSVSYTPEGVSLASCIQRVLWLCSQSLNTKMLLRIILLAAGMLLLTQLAESYSSRCDAGWSLYWNNCYIVKTDAQTWTRAQYACKMLNANLATITSSSENSAVARMMQSAGVYLSWTGLHDLDRDGQFQWVRNNRPVSYTNWLKGQPQRHGTEGPEDCGCLSVQTGYYWHDYPCSTRLSFVCEK